MCKVCFAKKNTIDNFNKPKVYLKLSKIFFCFYVKKNKKKSDKQITFFFKVTFKKNVKNQKRLFYNSPLDTIF